MKEMRSQDVPLSGPVIIAKAAGFAPLLGIENFMVSDRWFHRFGSTINLCFRQSAVNKGDSCTGRTSCKECAIMLMAANTSRTEKLPMCMVVEISALQKHLNHAEGACCQSLSDSRPVRTVAKAVGPEARDAELDMESPFNC